MDLFLKAVILGIVEGVTEFLPISSTGHLIILNRFLDFEGDFAKMFDIVIQLGAILSVVVYFRDRIFPFGAGKSGEQKKSFGRCGGRSPSGSGDRYRRFTRKRRLGISLQPSHRRNFSRCRRCDTDPRRTQKKSATISSVAELRFPTASIGLFQCLSMIPGPHARQLRSSAPCFSEPRAGCSGFSFFLAIPTMIAASGYSLLSPGVAVSSSEWIALAVGFVVSFVVALGIIAFS
jgi:undecaprenyl-diphosphatase